MSDFTVRSDSVDVEQIMRQIRARIREKRGVDYTEEEIRELANVKLETFLDPKGVRSDLLEQYRRLRESPAAPRDSASGESTIGESSRPLVRLVRRLLRPILKLFFPRPVIDALHVQPALNESYNQANALYYELIHNLVLETTRLSIEVKNLKMRVESMSSRLDFDERRARALEGVVQYRPGAVPPLQPPAGGDVQTETGPGERRTRRRRRRSRRRPGGGERDHDVEGRPHRDDAQSETAPAGREPDAGGPAGHDRSDGSGRHSEHDPRARRGNGPES
ncbi:MAG TPA: hypothetical protein VLD67_16720 [Vicinamibacterales bacterium]|nr:hypothetical protein [Vicinamibacterales bacterium]